jgi:hypothetical protein
LVSAFYHNHLFVPDDKADEALNLLQDMSGQQSVSSGQERNTGATRNTTESHAMRICRGDHTGIVRFW